MATATDEAAAHASAIPEPLSAPFRWVVASRWPPAALGLVASLVALGCGLAVTGVRNVPRTAVVSHVLYAFYWLWMPLATVSFVRGAVRDFEDLHPALASAPGGMDGLRRHVFRAAGQAVPYGLAIGLAIAAFDLAMIFGVSSPFEKHVVVYIAVREIVVCLGVFAVLGWATGAAWRLSCVAGERADADLLDPQHLAALTRCGRRLAFWFLLMNAVGLFFVLSPDATHELIVAVVTSTLALGMFAAAALLIPTWGGHRALERAKKTELARVRAQLRGAREAGDDGRLPGLLAWERRVDSVSSWPIDMRSARATGFYVLIPLVGWVAGALVERAVDALLG